MMHGALMFILVVAIFIVVAPLFWCGIIFLISQVGGWGSLGSHYGTSGALPGKGQSGRSLQMRRGRLFPANYSHVVNMHVDRDALYLSVSKLLKPFHGTLRLPFDDMNVVSEGQRKFRIRFWEAVDLTFMREPSIEVSLRKKDYEWIMETRENLSGRSQL